MEAKYSGFWMDDINSKLEAYIDFTSKKPTNDLPNLPEALQPSSTVFGFEELSFSTSKQI